MLNALEPRKGAASLMKRAGNLVSALFGQLVTRRFWGDLFSQVIRDMAFSLMASIGDSLMRFAKTKAIAAGHTVSSPSGGATTSPIGTAFARAHTPQPTYNPSAAVASGDTTPAYPGFGGRR